MEMASIGIAANNSYFYINNYLEPVHKSFYRNSEWPFTLGCMACISPYPADFYSLDPTALAGNKTNQQQKIFWSYLYLYAGMECGHYLVDLECLRARSYRCIFGQ